MSKIISEAETRYEKKHQVHLPYGYRGVYAYRKEKVKLSRKRTYEGHTEEL